MAATLGLFVLGALLQLADHNGGGPDSAPGLGFAALLLWYGLAAGFFLVNLMLVMVGLIGGRPVGHALIGCAMPLLVTLLFMAVMEALD